LLARAIFCVPLPNFYKIMDKYIDIDNIKLHYEQSGEGAPVILMHGWGCNTSTVASIARVAAQTHCVYNIDFPGFGKTNEPPTVWGVELYTQLIEKFVQTLGLNKPTLIGHSFGGRVGILYASRNDVDKLILVDAAGIRPRRTLKYYRKVYTYKLGKALARTFLTSKKAEKVIENWRKRSGSADYAAASSPTIRAIFVKVVNEDLKHVMSNIKAPTLLIWGEKDTATPLKDAQTMEKLIPNAGLVSFPGCGHYSFLDNPIQFAAVLTSFLKS
jgi:pimeloyl-ACP methyl ester carboxylesterase